MSQGKFKSKEGHKVDSSGLGTVLVGHLQRQTHYGMKREGEAAPRGVTRMEAHFKCFYHFNINKANPILFSVGSV